MKRLTLITLLCPLLVCAQDVDLSQYKSLEGLKGNAILVELNKLISDHEVLTYNDVRADKAMVDVQGSYIVDIYSDCSFWLNDYCYTTNVSACECYNREHTLPKSFWGGSDTEPMYTDLHHIYPTDYEANTQRSAWPYGEVTSSESWNNGVSKLGYGSAFGCTVFEPADEYKGDVARIYFYMVACYLDKNFTVAGKGNKVFTYSASRANFTTTAQNLFVKWQRNDPVSDKEIKRNNAVYRRQLNRNPFVDIPDLAEYIWGNKKSQAFKLDVTAIRTTPAKPDYTVSIDNHILNITAPQQLQLSVISTTGQMVKQELTDNLSISLPAGLYILHLDDYSQKIIVP